MTKSAQETKKRAPRPQYSAEYGVFVRHLRAAVERGPFTQAELAAKLGKPQSYISKVLAGYQALTMPEARKLLYAANVPFVEWVRELDAALREEERAA